MRGSGQLIARLFSMLACVCIAEIASAHDGPHAADTQPDAAAIERTSREMAAAAKGFLAGLAPEQVEKASFEFKDNERFNFHFIPKPRKGLTMKDMSPAQRELAKALLRAGLSEKGNTKVMTIMTLELILRDVEAGKGPNRDPEMYYWSVFGKPDAAGPWGWRVEGHHLSINFTVIGEKAVAGGPVFLGTNPAEIKEGPRKGLRVLAEEEDQGRAFVKLLSDEQQKKAIISNTAPKDIVTAAARQAVLKEFQGIAFKDLTAAQKEALMQLVGLYAHRLRSEVAHEDLRRIAVAGLDKVYFAWAGGLEAGQAHYYRVHGPTFLIEYDNTQNNANHIHSVWRDLENDFGGDALKRHYEQSPHHK